METSGRYRSRTSRWPIFICEPGAHLRPRRASIANLNRAVRDTRGTVRVRVMPFTRLQRYQTASNGWVNSRAPLRVPGVFMGLTQTSDKNSSTPRRRLRVVDLGVRALVPASCFGSVGELGLVCSTGDAVTLRGCRSTGTFSQGWRS